MTFLSKILLAVAILFTSTNLFADHFPVHSKEEMKKICESGELTPGKDDAILHE